MSNSIANRQVICDVLMESAAKDRDIVVLCSDSRGSASLAKFADTYPEQFVEVGIAEQDQSFAALQVLGTGAYGAYSSDVRRSAAELAWPGQTGTRLRALSERTDPQHLFDGGLNLRSQNSSAT